MSKSLRVSALLLVAFILAALPVVAGPADKAPTFTMAVGVPTVQPITPQDLKEKALDISRMPVLLDGVALPEGPQAQKALRELYLVIDDERGVINAYRTFDEFKANLKPGDCSNPGVAAAATQCVFFNGTNCSAPPGGTATRAVAVNCGFHVPGITGPTLLNGPITSFIIGCTTTFLCTTADCSGTNTCVGVTGTGCINVSVPNPFLCAGCQ